MSKAFRYLENMSEPTLISACEMKRLQGLIRLPALACKDTVRRLTAHSESETESEVQQAISCLDRLVETELDRILQSGRSRVDELKSLVKEADCFWSELGDMLTGMGANSA